MTSLTVLDSKATGIDVGSETMHCSIAGDTPRVFGTLTSQLHALIAWLKQERVQSVAVEATGVYWLSLYEMLEDAGIKVLVVNGRHVRNVPGRKTDMSDCQWLATLHAHGLLRSGFVPPAHIRTLQDYMRLRQDHTEMAASHTQHMQKAMERMNIKLHDVIADITGASGMRIVRAIVAGERCAQQLLSLCDAQILKNKSNRVLESLRGTWKKEQLFALGQALKGWDFYQAQISECDQEIQSLLREISTTQEPPEDGPTLGPQSNRKGAKRGGSNTPKIDQLHAMLVKLCGGIDPTTLPGMADHSLLKVISEVGTDLKAWPTSKHFAAWTGLAPGSCQSGKRKANQARHTNRAGQLFCDMARSLANSVDKALGGFYRRLKARRGGLVANKALARKLAQMFWQMMVHGVDYVEEGLKKYQARALASEQYVLAKLAHKHGLTLVPLKFHPA